MHGEGDHVSAAGALGAATQANRDFYDRLAEGRTEYWQYMAAPVHRRAVILNELQRLRPSPVSIVDIGCGGGELLAEIHRRLPLARLAGIDLSEHAIAENQRRVPEVRWYALDVQSSPLPLEQDSEAGRFNAIVAAELIEHLEAPREFLRNCRELAATEDSHMILSTQSGPIRTTERKVGHVKHYSANELQELLKETGWRPVRVWNTGFPFHDLSKALANLNPDASMQRFIERRYGILEKSACALLRVAFALNSRRRGSQLFAVATIDAA